MKTMLPVLLLMCWLGLPQSFQGRLDYLGNAPHVSAVIYLDDGRVFLVDPEQWPALRWDTGTYRFRGVLSAPRPVLPGLGIPSHDQVVHLLEAVPIPSASTMLE